MALEDGSLSEIISELHTLHIWNDNGAHLNSAEHSTFVCHTIPTMFPNLMLVTDNRHAAKHGKDVADLTVKIGKYATDRLKV